MPIPRAPGATPDQSSETLRPPPSGQPDSFAQLAQVFESGMAPARGSSPAVVAPSFAAQGEAHAQAALAACTRAEANLAAMLRTIQHLTTAVGSARDAKAEIVDELEQLRAAMASADEQQLTFKHRIAILEQTLERNEREAARERAFLFEQQDAFIAGLWDEHEQELTELRRRQLSLEQMVREGREENRALSSTAASAAARAEELTRKLSRAETDIGRLDADCSTALDALSRCQNERDQALALLTQMTRERDQLRADLARHLGSMVNRSSSSETLSLNQGAAATHATGTPLPMLSRSESSRLAAAQSESELQVPRSPSQITGSTPIARVPVSSIRSVPAGPEGAAISSRPPSGRDSAPQPAPNLGTPVSEEEAVQVFRTGIKQKPDPSTRPLIGYSLTSDDLHEAGLESSRPGSRGSNS